MSRPKVTVNAPNGYPPMRAHLDRQLPRFTALPEVVGITLNGGLSRGYADHLSEIDVTFHLTETGHQMVRDGRWPPGTGIQVIDGQLYDVKVVEFGTEWVSQWDQVALWDASYAEIIHDPTGQLANLFATKLASRPEPDSAAGPLFSAWWHFELAGNIWIHRDDPPQGHLMLNQAVVELLKALFLVNREYIPHDKWLVHLSRSLDWTPQDWAGRLTAVMCGITPTGDGMRERRQRIAGLWHDIDRYAITLVAPGNPDQLRLSQHHFFELLSWLVENAPVSLETWRERADPELLTRAPFNSFVIVAGGQVTVSVKQLTALTSDDLYPWFYDLVEAFRTLDPGPRIADPGDLLRT